MESTPSRIKSSQDCQFLAKPSFNAKDLPYVRGNKLIYVNLFKVAITKNWVIYQYPLTFEPEVAKENFRIKRALYSQVEKDVKKIYGECFLAGDTIFAFNEIKELQQVPLTDKINKIEYILKILPSTQSFAINNENPLQNPAIKQIYELIFKEILRSNPNLEFYRNLFVKTNEKKTVASKRNEVNFFPGYSTTMVYTTQGAFLNISIKNKILSTASCLEILQTKFMGKGSKLTKKDEDDIREFFIGRSIKTEYNKKNYFVDEISFDKTPKSTSFNKDGKNITILNYYKVAHGITIKNTDQPLFINYGYGSSGEKVNLYFVPELCVLAGIDDAITKDGQFMKSLAEYTKLTPKERVAKTNEFLPLLDDKKCKEIKDKKTNKVLEKMTSSYEKKNIFALQVMPAEKNSFNASYMSSPLMIAGKNTKISPEDRKPAVVAKAKDLTNWLCVYHKADYDAANTFFASLSKASQAYGIKVAEPEWLEMDTEKIDAWKEDVESYVVKGKKKFDIVVFVLDNYIDRLYKGLKVHSLCNIGYRSQVVKIESIGKNAMSVCSKILLQINYKLGGCTYNVEFDKEVKKQNFMIVGVDSSHISGKRTGVAMVASLNKEFTQFYNKIDLIDEKKKEQLIFCVSSFLKEAVFKYFEHNKKLPSGIIIYRQGVSRQQKEFLRQEVAYIENFLNGESDDKLLKGNSVPYYYILVNTKTSFKFFEKTTQRNTIEYLNPEPGLLVMEDITDPSYYEFYIQPQDVTQGTATPTCYHVAFGNLDLPHVVPKLTFDLCFLYANWTGPVRVPGPLKSAEKLSKMTAKYTKSEMHEKLKESQSYL